MPEDLRGWLDFYKKQIHTNDIDLNRLKAIPTPSENARNEIAIKQLNEDTWRSKVNLINEQIGAMQPKPPQEQPKAQPAQEQPAQEQPAQEQQAQPNSKSLLSHLKNPYVLGGLGIGALGLGGYAAYKMYQNSKKKKKKPEELTEKTSANLGLSSVPSGAGPQNMYNALNMFNQARTLVNPDETLKRHKLPREDFDAVLRDLSRVKGDSYDFDALR
jgi:ribosomal protein L12E/L44/L45/RPP1/RPP2